MNFLIVTAHLRKGGPVDVIYNLCKEYKKHPEIHVKIVTLRAESSNSKIAEFKKLGLEIIQLNFSRWECEIRSKIITAKIQAIISKEKIDIVNCHGYYAVVGCADLLGVKKISTLHNRANEDFINVYGRFIGNYMLNRYFKALYKYDLNVTVSKSAADYYNKIIPNVTYVNNGIDTDKFGVLENGLIRVLKEKLQLPHDKKILISTGRIEKEKRYEDLITWFNQLPQKNSLALVIVGDGSRLEACKKLAESNQNIYFTGRINNVADYLKCSDYFISYSKSEGMSMALCEAISCGLYPILSDIPSHHDAADAIDGYIYKEIEQIDMEEILSKKIHKEELHQYIVDNFSVFTMGNGYVKLFREING